MQRISQFVPWLKPAAARDDDATTPSARAVATPPVPRRQAPSGASMLSRPGHGSVSRADDASMPARSTSFTGKLLEWAAAAPADEREQRAKAVTLITTARANRQPSLSLCTLDLTTLPDCLAQLPHLKTLDVARNRLTTLPSLPPGLQILKVSRNQLVALPELLPETLVELKADSNQIATLPPLPTALRSLNVCKNQLRSLPPLPGQMRFLAAAVNQLSDLPVLPATLRDLWVADNGIARLPSLPAAVDMLSADRDTLDATIAQLQEKIDGLTAALAVPPAAPAGPGDQDARAPISGSIASIPNHIIQDIADHLVPGELDAVSLAAAHRTFKPLLTEHVAADKAVAIPPKLSKLRSEIERIDNADSNAQVAAVLYPTPAFIEERQDRIEARRARR